MKDIDITYAARPWTPGLSLSIEVETLRIPATRDVPEPEPVTWRDLNGRQPEEWEEAEIVAARSRERRLEWRP